VSKFADAIGQEWRLEFDGFLLDRIDKEAKVDLADLSATGLLSVERDVKALIRVLSVAVDDQLKERRKPAVEFQKQIRKDAIIRAREALLEALADFFPESEWSGMLSSLRKLKSQPDMTPDQLQLAMGFLKMDAEVQREVMEMIREQATETGSLPPSPEGTCVSEPDAIQSTLVADSQGNVTSAPEDTPSETSG